jgi:hypothetical protein
MALTDRFVVLWLPPEIIETFLGLVVPDPDPETAAATWTVAAQVAVESGPGLWLRVRRVVRPNGDDVVLLDHPVYFLRWEAMTTARLYDTMPTDIRRIG